MLCTEIDFDIQNNFFTQHVLPMFCKNKSFWQRFTCNVLNLYQDDPLDDPEDFDDLFEETDVSNFLNTCNTVCWDQLWMQIQTKPNFEYLETNLLKMDLISNLHLRLLSASLPFWPLGR